MACSIKLLGKYTRARQGISCEIKIFFRKKILKSLHSWLLNRPMFIIFKLKRDQFYMYDFHFKTQSFDLDPMAIKL